jgi:cytochrome c oxidase assembly protein subunit 15
MTGKHPYRLLRNLAFAGVLLAFVVVVLGAYTRLTDAGLGCPDWPGCYGHLTVPMQEQHIQQAEARFPGRPVEPHKAWNEMVHRYFAGTLGLLIFLIALVAWRERTRRDGFPVKLPSVLAVLVVGQALLGMWTVTMKLNPLVVMSHLLGGFTVFSLLLLLYVLSQRRVDPDRLAVAASEGNQFRGLAAWALVAVVVQVALGGWTSANYAAMVCTEFPVCHANWWSQADFTEAFRLWHHAENYEFGVKTLDGRIAIHALHRLWSVVALASVLYLGYRLQKASTRSLHRVGKMLLGLVSLQFVLGVLNVALGLPLLNAVAHNGVGALLTGTLVALNGLLWSARNIASIRS